MENRKKFWNHRPITDPDNALNIISEHNWEEQYKLLYENSLVGEVEQTCEKIKKLVKENDIDEISILTWCHNEKSRIKSYELFANCFNYLQIKLQQPTNKLNFFI